MSLEQDIALFKRVPLFSGLSAEPLRLIAFSAVRLDLAEGHTLFRADTKALSGFVVQEGRIELTDPGKRPGTATLGRFGPGTLLGETALFVETLRPATATAVEPSKVIEIDRNLMKRMLAEYPDVAAKLHAALRGRLAGTVSELASVGERLGQAG